MALQSTDKDKKGEMPVVIIVDDDLSYLEKLKDALEETYIVYTTSSGIEAIHLIKRISEVNVLIVSEELPRMRGTELLHILHEMFPMSESVIKILITDYPSNGTVIDLKSHGRIDSCCAKPIDPVALRRKVNYLLAKRSREKRATMRVTLNGSADVQITAGDSDDAELINISENGIYLKTLAFYPEGSTLPLKITLPDGRHHMTEGKIVRQDIEGGGIGIEFQDMDEKSRQSLLQFLSDYVTLQDLSELKLRYPFLKTDEMVLFSEQDKIDAILLEALKSKVEIAVINSQAGPPEILEFSGLQPHADCILSGEKLNIKFKTSDLIFISFQIGYTTYNFETMVSKIARDGRSLFFLYPKVMFYSEKRAASRIHPQGNLQVEIELPPPFDKTIRGNIADISPEGVSFLTNSEGPTLLSGTPLNSLKILEGDKLLWEEKGEVRNVTRIGRNGELHLRYGVQFGIGRMSIQSTRAPETNRTFPTEGKEKKSPLQPSHRKSIDFSELAHRAPEVIRVENQHGEEIVGLLNTSLPLDDKPIPVVIIPPAFGKTKEVLFALALTIVQNFFIMGKPVAVIRYDGIRRKGESYKDPNASEPPFEMVNANFTQGASDIKAILDWLQLNPKLKANSVILISFSLSALEARIVLRDKTYSRRIHYWISCMGTPEFRDLMIRVNCGLDFLEQYQLGIPLGIMPVLGNNVNVDQYVADGVANSVATLEQAREDMRHIDVPITWIYGKHDNWVRADFIRDIMSMQAPASREVISVPAGHSARTSHEALHLFGLIASLIHRFHHKEMIRPSLPNKLDMEIMRRAEKDRLPPRNLKNRKGYWQRYLVGDKNLLGFDIMALSDDYIQLMQDQLFALDLKRTDRLLDLGGGTGNFIEHLLNSDQSIPYDIVIADLIPEAMIQARDKLHTRFNDIEGTGNLSLLCLDVELGRFLPIQRYLSGEIGTFAELADKIENMDLDSALKIQKAYSPRLHRLLRGDRITPALEYWLKTQFELPEFRLIHDFNQAARYVRNLIPEKPSFRRLLFPADLESNLFLPIKPGWFSKILMSLVLSYIFNPGETLREVRRIIQPGGRLVLSSMRPDTDASGPFTRLMEKIDAMSPKDLPSYWPKPVLLESLRSFLNDAQALVDLEEAGTFDFFDLEKLEDLLEETGWEIIRTIPSFGDPPQGYVVVAEARNSNG